MDLIEAPEQNVLDIIEKLKNEIVIIEKIIEAGTMRETIELYYDYIKQGFEHRELRTCPVYFKFKNDPDELIKELELRHFLTNLMLWMPIVKLDGGESLSDDHITNLINTSIPEYANRFIIKTFNATVSNKKLNKILDDMTYDLSRISTDFNPILAMSINIETFIDVAKRNPRFNEIIRTKLDEDMQPIEIEEKITSLMKEQVQILINDDQHNFLQTILASGAGIKERQLAEFAINGGLKPDLDGKTIPVPINSNFIVRGLSNITNYFIDSRGGRKSVIMNKLTMGKAGHFARMIMLLTTDIVLDKKNFDCGTINSAEIIVRSKKHLSKLKHRYYRTKYERDYKVLVGDEENLIGQMLYVRTPAKCAGEKICRKCYGELYHTNKSLKSIGALAGSRITKPLSQWILSAKHLLTTQSDKIEFNTEFYNFFSGASNEIVLNTSNEDFNTNDYSIVIIRDNLKHIDEYGEEEFNCYISSFHVKNRRTGEMFEMNELESKDLYLSPSFKELVDRDKSDKPIIEINMSSIEDDTTIFAVEIANNELTKPLYKIMNLLNKIDHEKCETIDEMIQTMLDLIIESNIDSDSVHAEILIRPLVRSAQNILERPEFRKYVTKDHFELLTVESALIQHPSVLISMSFQHLNKQFRNPLTFKKSASSFIDPYFQERLT